LSYRPEAYDTPRITSFYHYGTLAFRFPAPRPARPGGASPVPGPLEPAIRWPGSHASSTCLRPPCRSRPPGTTEP